MRFLGKLFGDGWLNLSSEGEHGIEKPHRGFWAEKCEDNGGLYIVGKKDMEPELAEKIISEWERNMKKTGLVIINSPHSDCTVVKTSIPELFEHED